LDATIVTLQMREEIDRDRQAAAGRTSIVNGFWLIARACGSSMGMTPKGRVASVGHRTVVV
jgi:hypothetical protein